MIRTGLGYDLHKLTRGHRFILGGVEIPFPKGLVAHSDGDVLTHAVCDALLGAAALGDIGELFPPSDPQYKDANSMILLHNVYQMIKQQGWQLVNLDCVVICENPKVLPWRETIRNSLANTLEVSADRIFLKGKTTEGLGPAGKGKAVEVFATCLLEKK